MKVKIKQLTETAIIPQYQTNGAAAIDLHADLPGKKYILVGSVSELIPTGLSMSIPNGYVGVIVPRSSLGHKKAIILGNGTGIIDSDYRGPIMVSLYNRGFNCKEKIEPGDRIAQMLFMPVQQVAFQEVDELDETERGEGGFGSTGK